MRRRRPPVGNQRIHGRWPSQKRKITRTNPWDDSPRGWLLPDGEFFSIATVADHADFVRSRFPEADREDDCKAEAFALNRGWVHVTGFADQAQYQFVSSPTQAQRSWLAKNLRGYTVAWAKVVPDVDDPEEHPCVDHGTGFHWSAAGKRTRGNPPDPWDEIPTMDVDEILAIEKGRTQEGWITPDGLFRYGITHRSIAQRVYGVVYGRSNADLYDMAFRDGAIRAIAETGYGQFAVEIGKVAPTRAQIATLRRIERGKGVPILWELGLRGGGRGVAELENFLRGLKSNPPSVNWSALPRIGPGDVASGSGEGFHLWVTPSGRIFDASVLGGEAHPTSAMAVTRLDSPHRAIMAVLRTGAMRVSSYEDEMGVSFTQWPTPDQVAIVRVLMRKHGISGLRWDRHDQKTAKVAESGSSVYDLSSRPAR